MFFRARKSEKKVSRPLCCDDGGPLGRPFSLLRAYGGLTGTRLGTVLGSRRGHHTPAKTKSDDFGGFLAFLEALAVQMHRFRGRLGRDLGVFLEVLAVQIHRFRGRLGRDSGVFLEVAQIIVSAHSQGGGPEARLVANNGV